MNTSTFPPVGTHIRVTLPEDAPASVRHAHTGNTIQHWRITGYEDDKVFLEGRRITDSQHHAFNEGPMAETERVKWSVKLGDEAREILAAYAQG